MVVECDAAGVVGAGSGRIPRRVADGEGAAGAQGGQLAPARTVGAARARLSALPQGRPSFAFARLDAEIRLADVHQIGNATHRGP